MGTLNPWGILFGLSIIPIIYLYFIKQEKTVLEVSSIIPWKNLEEDRSTSKEKFAFDFLLLLQILVISIIVSMLMRLYYQDTIKVHHRILLVDASASMKTIEPDGNSRLDKAKAKAYDLIDGIGSDDRMMVIRMAGTPRKLSEFISDKGRLKAIVKSIEAGDTRTNFRASISLALSGIQGLDDGRIYIMGDRSRDSEDVHHLLGGIENADERLFFSPVGESSENVAITSLDIYQSVYESIKKKIYITARNYSSKTKSPVLKIFIGGKLVFRKQIKLSPGEFRILPFGNIKESGLLKVKIEDKDALISDNTAYGLIRKNKTIRLLLVTEDKQFTHKMERICKAAESIQAVSVLPGKFHDIDLDNFDIALFHQNTPENIPPINSIFIYPPPDSMLFNVSLEPMENPDIVDWNRKHPALKYLDFLDTIPVRKARKITLPHWAIELISSQDFPLAFWGIQEGYKRIVFGFDLSEHFFSPSQDITGLIILLNLIDWITPAQADIKELQAGNKYLLASGENFKNVQIAKPDGTVVELEEKDGQFVFTDTETVGLYQVNIVNKDGSELTRRFFTNLLDENESRIKPAISSAVPVTPKTFFSGQKQLQQYEIWRYLLLAALLFLLIEWWVYFRRVE